MLPSLALLVSLVINESIRRCSNFCDLFTRNDTDDVRTYTEIHREGNRAAEFEYTGWLSEAQTTGGIFSGRKQVRPNEDFGTHSRKANDLSCKKNYLNSDSHSPGIFTVQCVCSNSNLMGISVMQECEGVSSALSVLLSRFEKVPKVWYYNNACNMCKSITLKFPWVYEETLVVCDRYHYSSHTCDSTCDPDSCLCCEDYSTSGAESIDLLWNFSKPHLRFLSVLGTVRDEEQCVCIWSGISVHNSYD